MRIKIFWTLLLLTSFLLTSFFLTLPSLCSEESKQDRFILVKGGTFLMGNKEIPGDEVPISNTAIKNFYIGKYEVTQGEWQAVMGNNPSLYKGDNCDNRPVENISWYDAVEYCNKKSLLEGLQPCYLESQDEKGNGKDITCNFAADGYRLPTEAEWEYTCHGGAQSLHYMYSGSNDPNETSWFELNSNYKIHPIGQKKPNELGIYDMSGNVAEWCWDFYDKESQKRVYRGGNADDPGEFLRCTVRFSALPVFKYCDLGFRVVKNDQGNPIGLKNMVLVQGSVFKTENSSGKHNEKLVHPVTVSDFYIAKFEVTQEEWRDMMGENPSYRHGSKCPVNFVDWYSAVQYCNKRSRKQGLTPCYTGNGDQIKCDFEADGYRLPTEAEWEYACRGGVQTHNYMYSGSNDAGEVAWHGLNTTIYFEPVGTKKSNELGIYDMSGNMWEWCWDWYDINYYKNSPEKNPSGPITGIRRVIRGGSWRDSLDNLPCSARFYSEPLQKSAAIGFRVVKKAK